MVRYRVQRANSTLSDSVKRAIIEMLRTEEFETNKLPAESKLAARFGVSLASVREALLLLREEGIITKRHGSGNYFHLSALDSDKRLDQFPGFAHLLRSQSYDVTQTSTDVRIVEATDYIRGMLKVGKEEQIVYYERTLYANERPAIHCENYFPRSLFTSMPDRFESNMSIFDIFWNYMGKELAYGKLEFKPHLTTNVDMTHIGVAPGEPIILVAETYYSLEDIPLAFSFNKFNHDYVKITMFSR